MAGNPLRHIAVLYRDAFGGLPALTWVLCAAGFINRCGSMVVPFLSLYLKKEFDYSAAQAGGFLSAYGLGAFAGSWLGGWLTDRHGPVRTQIATLASTGVWMLLMTQIREPWLLAISVFVLGVLNDAFRPGSLTAVAISCEPALRRKALSLNRLAMNAGWAFGPTIGGYLTMVDFRLMFVADGGTCALAALWLFVCSRHWNPAPPPREADDARHGQPLLDRHFLCLMAANLAVLIAFMQYFTTGTRFLEDHGGYSKSQIGWFLAINPVMIMLFEMPTVHLLRHRAALPLVARGAAIVGLGYLCLLLPIGGVAVVIAMVVVAAGELLQMPMLGAYVNDHAPPHARGAYNGAYGMTFCAGLVLAPLLGGALYDAAGPDALWWSCGACGLAACIGFALLHRSERLRLARGRP
jgi:predicted MFS family arabinose efflux permease